MERDHEDEAEDDRELAWLAEQRTRVRWIAPPWRDPLKS
jgi:riboflavin synthase